MTNKRNSTLLIILLSQISNRIIFQLKEKVASKVDKAINKEKSLLKTLQVRQSKEMKIKVEKDLLHNQIVLQNREKRSHALHLNLILLLENRMQIILKDLLVQSRKKIINQKTKVKREQNRLQTQPHLLVNKKIQILPMSLPLLINKIYLRKDLYRHLTLNHLQENQLIQQIKRQNDLGLH